MTRYDTLMSIYHQFDTIYAALILASVWAASTGHLLDWITQRRGQILVTIFWTLLVILYVAGMVAVGLNYS